MPGAPRIAGGGSLTASLRATFFAVALAIIVPFILLVGYLAYGELTREKRRVQHEALAQATMLATQIEKHLTVRLDGVAAAAAVVAASGNDAATIEAQARRLRQSFPDVERVLVVDDLGLAVASVPPAREGRRAAVGDQEWFKRAATSTEPSLGGASQVGPDVLVSVYAPARTPEGRLRGVMVADLSLKRVQEMLSQARLAKGAVAELLTEKAVVARQPGLSVMRDIQGLPGYPDLFRRQEATGELVFEDGESRLVAAVAVRPVGWVLAVGLPSAHVLADTRGRLGWIAGAAAVVALLGLASTLVIARRHASGMARLRAAMRRLEAGDMPATVPVTVGGDVGALTEGFNHMLGWLHRRVREYEALSQVEEAADGASVDDRSVDGVLPGLLRKVVGGMGADAGVVLMPDETGLLTKAAVGFSGIPTEGVRLRRGQGLAGAVVAHQEAVAIPDVDADYRVDEPYIREAGLRSVAGAPMVSGDQLLGVIEVGYRMPHAFASGEIQRLEAMTRRTAQALERARAIDAVRRNTAGLEAQLAEKLEALQQAAMEQAETRRQAQEARRQAQELEQTIKMQAAQGPQVKEIIVEKEVVRFEPVEQQGARLRAVMQKTVSEELRAPLSALLDLPRFLVEGLNKPLGEDERQQLEILRDRGEEILELIDNLVVLSGLEAGQVKIVKAPFDLPTLIHRVVRGLQPRAAAKGNRIDADIKRQVGQVVSDSKRVEQILWNLLVTAIKYTEVGEIRVTCYIRDADVVLTVADDGVGFSPDEEARIFEPFLHVAPRDGRTFPGTGLSLTVCQRLVEVLGGRIRVESEIDRGTWFTVSLPVQS